MKHYLNVCDIDGSKIEPVDIITFGSPCQDLSVAGKRAGIHDGERSNLFFEAIRIIKEMRKATNDEYPKFAVWENVPGAFSSNKGRDFHAVLQAFCSVCDDTVSIPEPYDKKRTKLVWSKAGEIVGDNYSVAWRTLDAQYWGVPQRRKRIYLVADFTGRRAGKILFKPDSVRGYLEKSDEARKETAGDAVGGADRSSGDGGVLIAYSFDSLSSNSMKSSNPYSGCRAVDVAKCIDTTYPCPSKNQGGIAIVQPVIALQANGIDRADMAGCNGCGWRYNESYTLNTIDRHAVCYDARGNGDGETAYTITGDHQNRITDYTAVTVCKTNPTRKYIIRRLTPTECARLQGFPDWWGELAPYDPADAEFWEQVRKTHAEITGKTYKPAKNLKKWYNSLHTDSAEYKMWGNGIALPCAQYVLQGIAEQGARTLGSLFDGSGGFPLAGVLNGINPIWASEVEPYCIAVTKSRFG